MAFNQNYFYLKVLINDDFNLVIIINQAIKEAEECSDKEGKQVLTEYKQSILDRIGRRCSFLSGAPYLP